MRFLYGIAALLLLHSVIAEETNSWSWSGDQNQDNSKLTGETIPEEDLLASSSDVAVETIQLNSTEVDKVVDDILVSNRQGRALDGFDEVYSDPTVQEALQNGDDSEARNLIKDRLCQLGLMQCQGNVQGKRPFISPEELVYAQPVAINPVGQPIPTIPLKGIRGGSGNYGPPKPLPYPGGPTKFGPPPSKFGPPPSFAPNKPPRRGYGPPPNKQFYGPPPHKPFVNGEIYEGSEFLTKPPSGGLISDHDIPYEFDQGSHQFAHHKDKKVEVVVNAHGGSASVSGGAGSNKGGVQEHVHHHYHHNLDGSDKAPTVVVNPIPIAAAAAASSGSSHLSQSSNIYGGSHSSHGSNFFKPSSSYNPLSSGSFGGGSTGLTIGGGSYGGSGLTIGGSGFGSGSYGGQTIASYGGSSGLDSFGVKPVQENYGAQTFGTNSFGASVGSYGSTGLYKKELNLNSNSINSNYLQSNYAEKYQGVESARAENYDCICVPYDQCPSHDIIGRKDDLYLALDPRNLKSDIEAIIDEERVITDGNGTMTVVRVPKDANLNATEAETVKNEEVKKVTKREAPVQNKDGDDKSKVEARQYGSITNNKNVKPTFGISFGLPQQGGGGYPINPYGPNPHINPYGGTIGSSGINLGLVSVNPLLSLQVTKDDYGEKVYKPFINLHVTPNNYLVHKFEDILSYKKHIIFNKHKHLHYHKPSYYPHGPQHYYGHGGPEIHHGPEIYHGPPGPEIYGPPGPVYDGPGAYEGHGPPGPIDYEGPPHYHHSGHDHYNEKPYDSSYFDDPLNYGGFGGGYGGNFFGRAFNNNTNYVTGNDLQQQYEQKFNGQNNYGNYDQTLNTYNDVANEQNYNSRGGKSLSNPSPNPVKFPTSRKRRDLTDNKIKKEISKRQAHYGNNFGRPSTCGPRHVCCKRPLRPHVPNVNRQCGTRHSQGINGRIKNPVYVDGDSEFGEYPWQVAILKKDPKESVYVCGGTLIDPLHIITAAHCVKTYTGFDLRVRLGEWDVNHDVEFYPYIERDIQSVSVHPEFYAGTLYNDLAILRMDKPVDWSKHPHISPACLPHPQDDYTGTRCWTTGWGKDAFGDFGKYQNILKEVDVPIVGHGQCQRQLQQTRLGYDFKLHPGFVCAGGEEGKDACKGDGGGPMVCERGGTWQVVGVVSWGIGCGQHGVPGVYVKVAHYLDWIRQVTQRY